MGPDRMRALVSAARSARLATIDPDGAPNLVPVVFALDDDEIHLVVDAKPKSTRALRRLTNIERDPRVTILADHYDEDWDALWWVRVRGRARVLGAGEDLARTIGLLRAKYEQYRSTPIEEIGIVVAIEDWRGWSARDA